MGNGGAGAGKQHPTVSFTFDDENAKTNFENQLPPPLPAHTNTQQHKEDGTRKLAAGGPPGQRGTATPP